MESNSKKDNQVESKQLSFDFNCTSDKPVETSQVENSFSSEDKEIKGRIIPLQYHLDNESEIYRSILNRTMQ